MRRFIPQATHGTSICSSKQNFGTLSWWKVGSSFGHGCDICCVFFQQPLLHEEPMHAAWMGFKGYLCPNASCRAVRYLDVLKRSPGVYKCLIIFPVLAIQVWRPKDRAASLSVSARKGRPSFSFSDALLVHHTNLRGERTRSLSTHARRTNLRIHLRQFALNPLYVVSAS